MSINRLVSSVNASRAKEDFLYRKSPEIEKGLFASPRIYFEFMGSQFVTELPYLLRLTIGSVIRYLNSSNTYLIAEGGLKRVIFLVDTNGNVSWTTD